MIIRVQLILQVYVAGLVYIKFLLFDKLHVSTLPAAELMVSQQSVLRNKEKYCVVYIVYQQTDY
jgi:hypothetical protein